MSIPSNGTFPWRIWLGLACLGAQGVAFVYAKFVPTRYFCWAPYDQNTYYTVEAWQGERALGADEIYARYRVFAQGHNPRSYTEITHTIAQYEQTYGAGEGYRVRVIYNINGTGPQTWIFPEAR